MSEALRDNPDQLPLIRMYVSDYINHWLTSHNFEWDNCPDLPPPDSFSVTMRALGDEFQTRYRNVFNDMSSHLHITPTSVEPVFVAVSEELFSSEIGWGRIVALFAFSGAVSLQCMNKEIPCLVDSIVNWTSTFINNRLLGWILDNGSWDAINDYYYTGIPDCPPGKHKYDWITLKNYFFGVAVGAAGILALGAVFLAKG